MQSVVKLTTFFIACLYWSLHFLIAIYCHATVPPVSDLGFLLLLFAVSKPALQNLNSLMILFLLCWPLSRAALGLLSWAGLQGRQQLYGTQGAEPVGCHVLQVQLVSAVCE